MGVPIGRLLPQTAEDHWIVFEVLWGDETLNHTVCDAVRIRRAGGWVDPGIQVEGPLQMPAEGPHVTHGQDHLSRQFTLDRQVVVDRIRYGEVRIEQIE